MIYYKALTGLANKYNNITKNRYKSIFTNQHRPKKTMILADVKKWRKNITTIAYKYTKLDFFVVAGHRHNLQFLSTRSGRDKIKQNQLILPLIN